MHFISIIIPTYNREKLVDLCIHSLCNQELDKEMYEVIVVNNNSQDGTEDVILKYIERYKNVRSVNETKQGAANARNRGVKEAHGEYLGFVDDLVVVPPEYLTNVLKVLSEQRPDILGGPIYPLFMGPKPWWYRDEYEIRKHAAQSGFCAKCRVNGGNFVIKRDVLERVGMFPPALGPIGNKMNYHDDSCVLDTYRKITPESEQRVFYSLECCVRIHVPPERMRIGYVLSRSFNIGRSAAISAKLVGNFRWRLVTKIVTRGFRQSLADLVVDLTRNGVRQADYINFLRKWCLYVGWLRGALS